MKIYTEVEVDLQDVEELVPIAREVNDFLDDYEDEIEDADSSEITALLNRSVELLKKISECLN